jgi:flagellar FliL protein
MAEDKNDQAEAAPQKSGGGLLGKLIIGGFMGGVVLVEVLLAYLLIPSKEEVAALAEENLSKKLPASLVTDELAVSEQDQKDSIEVDLGDYSLTAPQRNGSTALRVDFHLVGTVLEDDESEMSNLMDRHPARFRELVLYEIRNSEREDLDDPQLGLIKRRILGRSTDLFGKPILKSLVFDDFSYIEQ